jgi:hypothetical protein
MWSPPGSVQFQARLQQRASDAQLREAKSEFVAIKVL